MTRYDSPQQFVTVRNPNMPSSAALSSYLLGPIKGAVTFINFKLRTQPEPRDPRLKIYLPRIIFVNFLENKMNKQESINGGKFLQALKHIQLPCSSYPVLPPVVKYFFSNQNNYLLTDL